MEIGYFWAFVFFMLLMFPVFVDVCDIIISHVALVSI